MWLLNRRRFLCSLVILTAISRAALNTGAQMLDENAGHSGTDHTRIIDQLDETQLIKLRGNTIPFAIPANDRGAAPSNQTMRRMLMLLHRGPEQEAALAKLLESQQDSSSREFHLWLTPEQFGAQFGPASQDIQTVSNWLSAHGFTNVRVSTGRTLIEFSGNAGQVQSAFHTEIHRYQVNGEMHLSNDRDPSIPAALAPVVAGVVSLNDFGRRSMAIRGPTLRSTKGQPHPQIVPQANPDFTVPGPNQLSSFYGVGPYDFATIYDLLPLWNAGLDGTGQTIAIVGETDINLNDTEDFRAYMGLPVNDPTVLIAGADPGVQSDELESDLDVEWSGAVAKGARIELVSAASTETTPGVDLAALYIVDNNLAPVMSESYGKCELFLGTTANAFENAMWQQAAAEGITVLISSGDEGSTECDPTTLTQNLAVHPMAVSGLASTPYNVAVGGTDFNQYNNWTQYWSDTNDPTTKQSVLGYIPEIPWNDSCGSSILDATFGEDPTEGCDEIAGTQHLNTIAGSGGPSSCVTSNGTDPSSCTGGWPKPVWQSGTGVPADSVRDIPDVSLFASNGVYNSAYIVCDADATPGSSCDPTGASQTFIAVGGTSAGAPAMAGVMAIINQKYGRQGNANFTLYRLASSAAGSSIFHDITADGNRVACNSVSPDCQIPTGGIGPFGRTSGHDSTVGYDMATGLGSVDIANLVNNWSAVAFTPTKTSLDLNGGNGTVTAVHGTAISATVNVTAASGSPGGDVSLIGATTNGSTYLGSLQGGTVTGTVNNLPGGSYAVTAYYAGDTQFAPSNSSAVNVNISPEASTTKLTILNYVATANAFESPASTVPYGSLLLLRSDVKGQSGYGNATGAATLTDGSSPLGQFGLNSEGYTEDIPSNLILAGTHTFGASFPGDASFKASSGTGRITVTAAPMTCTLSTNTNYLRPGWVVVATANTVYYEATPAPALGNMVAPTGTMSISSGSTVVSGPTTVTGTGSATLLNGAAFELPHATIPTVTLQFTQLATPTAPLTITYSGDANYASCTSPPLVLQYQTGPVTTQIQNTFSAYQNIVAGTPVTISATVMAANQVPSYEPAIPTPTGTFQLAIDGVNAGAPVQVVAGPNFGALLTGTASVILSTAGLSAGTHTVALSYSGDANYLPISTGAVNISIVVPDFSISASPTSLTVTNGQTTSPVAVQVGYSGGFSGTVSFSCSGLPSEAACVFSPTTLTNAGSTSLTITTTQAQMMSTRPITLTFPRRLTWMTRAGGISVAFLVLVSVPRRRRKGLLISCGVTGIFFLGIASCGGGSGGSTTPPPTQYSTQTQLSGTTQSPAKGATDTFTATVSAIGTSLTPTGTVQFNVDGTASGSPVVLSRGKAQFQTSFATNGAHTVSASYSGDTTDLGSQSSAYSVNVPYSSGSLPGNYNVTVTATSGSVMHSTTVNLLVQ